MSRFIGQLTLISASGFVLSLLVHILGLLNKARFFGWVAMPLHLGIFVVLLGALIAYFRLRQSEGSDFWKRALRASPFWMRWILPLILIYAVFNFLIFWNEQFKLSGKSSDEIVAIMLRGFSGHWMFFYYGTFLVFYAAMRATEQSAVSKT